MYLLAKLGTVPVPVHIQARESNLAKRGQKLHRIYPCSTLFLQEIVELEKRFWHLVGTSTTGRIDYNIISGLVSPPLHEALVPGLFRAFDENQVS